MEEHKNARIQRREKVRIDMGGGRAENGYLEIASSFSQNQTKLKKTKCLGND